MCRLRGVFDSHHPLHSIPADTASSSAKDSVNRFAVTMGILFLSLVPCAAVVAFLFVRIDVPTALRFWKVVCAYGINDYLVKAFFGAPTPTELVQGAAHGFNLWKGSRSSSFP
jgi:hypothetical protein